MFLQNIYKQFQFKVFMTDKKNNFSKTLKDLSKNYWAISTIILAILLIAILTTGGSNSTTMDAKEVGQKVLSFANNQGANAGLVSVNDNGQFYEVVLLINGQEVPVQVTKDGENLIPQLIPLTAQATQDTTTPTQTKIPKSDKPVVELYVFTYCPYGTQSEKGIIPVINLLGDKIDFKLRQIGAMHGEYEKIEAKRQLCIKQEQPDKLLSYVLNFALDEAIGKCGNDATCSEPLVNNLFTKLGINKAKIETCMKNNGETLYAEEEANSRNQGVGGSPTLLINGAKAQSGRDSASYLAAICSAFSEMPEECNEVLSSASPTPGFGSGASASSSTSAQC